MKFEITKDMSRKQWDELLGKMHQIQIKLANELKRICEKHGINYFMVAATSLGAVRHGGFIPWDDKMDFGMLRRDYEKFLEVAESELSEDFFLQNWHTDLNYGLAYTQLRDTHSIVVETNQKEKKQTSSGIAIRIFPYDYIMREYVDREHWYQHYQFHNRLLMVKNGYRFQTTTFKQKLLRVGLTVFAWLQPRTKLIERLQRLEQETNEINKTSELLISFAGLLGSDFEAMEEPWCTQLKDWVFEDSSYPMALDGEMYLVYRYGNYWDLPPEHLKYPQLGFKRVEIFDRGIK